MRSTPKPAAHRSQQHTKASSHALCQAELQPETMPGIHSQQPSSASHLDEANILCVLPKALPAHVQVVLPDDAPVVAAHAAAVQDTGVRGLSINMLLYATHSRLPLAENASPPMSTEASRPLTLGWQWTHARHMQANWQSLSVS